MRFIQGKLYRVRTLDSGYRPMLRKDNNGKLGEYLTISELVSMTADKVPATKTFLLFLGQTKFVDWTRADGYCRFFYRFLLGEKIVLLDAEDTHLLE